MHPISKSSSTQTAEPIVKFHTILEMGSHDESAHTLGSSLRFLEVPQKGFFLSDCLRFLEQNVSSTFCHQTSSTCHTDTTHGVEYGVSHPLTPSSSPVTVLYCTVLYHTVLYCTVLYHTVLYCTVQKDKKDKNTEIQKDKITPTQQGAQRAPKPSAGARTRGP